MLFKSIYFDLVLLFSQARGKINSLNQIILIIDRDSFVRKGSGVSDKGN